MAVNEWMAWEAGIDLCGVTQNDLVMPNVLVHVARVVHTPLGSAPCGMVLYQPDPSGPPEVVGFVSPDKDLAGYFGPKIFAGTPFEAAPALEAKIEVDSSGLPGRVLSRVEVAGRVLEVTFDGLGESESIDRAAGAPLPFRQQVLEASVGSASLTIDGSPVELTVPPAGIAGGPGATFSATGIYSR